MATVAAITTASSSPLINCSSCGLEAIGASFRKWLGGKIYYRKQCLSCRVKQAREWRRKTGYTKKYYNGEKHAERLAYLREYKKRPEVKARDLMGRRKAYWRNRAIRAGIRPEIYWQRYNDVGGICYICNLYIPFEQSIPDHIIPLIRRGNKTIDNVLPVHKGCNAAKRDSSVEEVLSWR